jgi:hypothetical protein
LAVRESQRLLSRTEPGYLYESESDADIADWAIVWADAQEDGCNQTALDLYDPSLTKQEGKQEF